MAMMDNPLQKLVPKDPQGSGMGGELKEKMNQVNNARQALNPDAPKPAPAAGAPSPMKPVKGPYGSQPGEKRIDTTFPDSPMPKFHTGGTVKQDGPAILKKGEKVLTADQHGQLKAAMGLAQSALSHEPEKDKEPKPLREMHVRELNSGGFHILRHDGKGKTTEHAAPDADGIHDHVEDHFGTPNDGEEESENQPDSSPSVVAMQKDLGFKK